MGSVSLGAGNPLQGLLQMLASVQNQRQQSQEQGLGMMKQGFIPSRPAPAESFFQKLLTPGPSLGPADYQPAPWQPQIAESQRAERGFGVQERGQDINQDINIRQMGLQKEMAELDREVARYQAETQRSQGKEQNRISWAQIQKDEALRNRAMDIQYELEGRGLTLKAMEYRDGQWYGLKTDNGVVMFQTGGMGAGPESVKTVPDTGKIINTTKEYLGYLGMEIQTYLARNEAPPNELMEEFRRVRQEWWDAQGKKGMPPPATGTGQDYSDLMP